MSKRVYVLEKIERKSTMSPNEHHYDVSFFYNNDLTYGRIGFVVPVGLLEKVKPLMTQDEMDEIFND